MTTRAARPICRLVGTVAFLAPVLGFPGAVRAQGCCSPSTTPVSALHTRTTPTGAFDVGVFYEYFRQRGDPSGTTTVPDRQDPLTRLHVANLVVGFAPWNRLGFRAVASWARRSREQTLVAPTVNRSDTLVGTGLGDITILAQWQLLPRKGPPRPFSLSVGGGVKFGTGQFSQRRNGVPLPPDLQPGTGCEDLVTTAYGEYYRWVGWNVFGGMVWRLTGTNSDRYRYGNEAQAFAGASREVTSTWRLMLEGRYRHASSDRRGGVVVSSTGNDRLFVVPGVGVRVGARGPTVLVSALLPVYERANGAQLRTSIGVNIALEYRFKLNEGP